MQERRHHCGAARFLNCCIRWSAAVSYNQKLWMTRKKRRRILPPLATSNLFERRGHAMGKKIARIGSPGPGEAARDVLTEILRSITCS